MNNITQDSHVRKISDVFIAESFQQYCGLSLLEQNDGFCATTLKVTHKVGNAAKRLHAGVIYAVLDVTAFLASLTVVKKNQYPVTHNINVSMILPARQDDEVIFESSIIKTGKNLIFINSSAFIHRDNNSKKLIAQAMITKFILNEALN